MIFKMKTLSWSLENIEEFSTSQVKEEDLKISKEKTLNGKKKEWDNYLFWVKKSQSCNALFSIALSE